MFRGCVYGSQSAPHLSPAPRERKSLYIFRLPPSSVSISLSSPGCSRTSLPNSTVCCRCSMTGRSLASPLRPSPLLPPQLVVAAGKGMKMFALFLHLSQLTPRLSGLCPADVYPGWTDSPAITLPCTSTKKNKTKENNKKKWLSQKLQGGWKTKVCVCGGGVTRVVDLQVFVVCAPSRKIRKQPFNLIWLSDPKKNKCFLLLSSSLCFASDLWLRLQSPAVKPFCSSV